jgi:hypothetical protein
MKAKTSRRSKRNAGTAGDLAARNAGVGAVKGGIVINWMPKAGADRPGETQGVIAIIGPDTTLRAHVAPSQTKVIVTG